MTAYPLIASPGEWLVTLDRFLGPPLQIGGILVGALVGRWLLHRLIRSTFSPMQAGWRMSGMSSALRPWEQCCAVS